MAAVAAKTGLTRELEAANARIGHRPRTLRRRKNWAAVRRLLRWVTVTTVLVGFVYLGMCAYITSVSNHNAKLARLCREQQIEKESLQAALVRYSSPQHIAAVAQREGMVSATNYEYLKPPRSVASVQ